MRTEIVGPIVTASRRWWLFGSYRFTTDFVIVTYRGDWPIFHAEFSTRSAFIFASAGEALAAGQIDTALHTETRTLLKEITE